MKREEPGVRRSLEGAARGERFASLVDASIREFDAHAALQVANDETRSVYLVLNGWLVISKTNPDGGRQIIDFVMPGNLFDPGSADARLSSTDVHALTEARIAVISREVWLRHLSDEPQAQDRLNRRLAGGYAAVAERLLRLGKGDAETRVAYAICELGLRANDLGLVGGREFHLPLTQQVLGDFVGLSSVHISRTIGRFVRQGVLSYGDHMDVVVHDIDRLAEIAEIDLDELRRQIITAA